MTKRPALSDCEIIARAIIVSNGRLLVNRGTHPDKGQCYYALPGGHVERGESCAGALQRELQEELKIACEIGSLAFVLEQMYDGRHAGDSLRHELVLYFEVTAPADISFAQAEAGKDFQWLPLAHLAGAPFLSAIAASTLQKYFCEEKISSYVFQDNITRDNS